MHTSDSGHQIRINPTDQRIDLQMNFAANEERPPAPVSPEPLEVPPPPSPESEMSGSTENSRDPPFVETVHYARQNTVSTVILQGIPIVSLVMDAVERLCLAQISNTLLKAFSYNEIHNRRVALGITCVQCTPVQLEILRRAGAMPISSRRCGMITKREAERLVRSFLGDTTPPKLPDNFAFDVTHSCGWGCTGKFVPSRYNSSRAKCIKCNYCNIFFSPNKFIFHFHRAPNAKYHHPDAANFNSWRRHLNLEITATTTKDLMYAWEDVKAMFNGGSRKRLISCSPRSSSHTPDVEEKRPRMESHESMPKLSSISYPYPVLPLANNSVAAAAAAAAACSMPGYVARPPHPAFPFPMPDDTFQSHENPNKVQEQNAFADLWKAKGSPYCNPFGFLWAKNFSMYNDPSVQYRSVIDLSRSSQQKPQSSNAIEGKPEESPISPLPVNMPWPTFGKMPLDRKAEHPNYFSAFKPVSRDSQSFERRPNNISPVSDDKWPPRPQSIESCNSQLLDNDLASPDIDADEENINVTDVDSSEIPRSPVTSGSKDDVRASLKSPSPGWKEDHDLMTKKESGQHSQDSSDQVENRKSPEPHEVHIENKMGKDEEITTDSVNNNEVGPFCHMSKDDLQMELCKLLDERSKAEQEYQNILDAISSRKPEENDKQDVAEQMQVFQDCFNNPREKKEKTALFSKLQEARDALMQFSSKMVALRSSIHS